ncbi:MAG: hypothetical protein WCO55_04860 [Candidatus Falkowbacteria bacterium]
MINDKNILFGLTTTGKSNWRDKTEEIKELNIKELALLPSMLSIEQRKELYSLLEATGLQSIPYCSLREDFIEDEVAYLIDRYKTKYFSVKADAKGLALQNSFAKYATMISVENPLVFRADTIFDKAVLAQHQVIGICLDLARYQAIKDTDKKIFKKLELTLSGLPVKVNRVSPCRTTMMEKLFKKPFDGHHAESLHDFAYLKSIPNNYFSSCLVLDLENSFVEQQEIAKYIEMIIKNK